MDADYIGRMLNRQPSVVAYKLLDDLVTLKEWFYVFNEKSDNRERAIQKVKALCSRGRLPHAIETTSLLTSVYISDPKTNKSISKHINNDSNMLQLSYSMALTRFVNGLLDPLQQSNFAIPLHQLAKSLQLPSYFVELRHMATHEKLPSLEMLRLTTTNALSWLYDNYWSKIEDIELFEEEGNLSTKEKELIQDTSRKYSDLIPVLVSNLKTFKKIRKQDLNYIYKVGNSTENGLKYWKAIQKVSNHLQSTESLLFNVLIFKDFIIYNQLEEGKVKKIGQYLSLLYKLYDPLLDHFGYVVKKNLIDFIIRTLSNDFDVVTSQINRKFEFQIEHDYQKLQLSNWVAHIFCSIYDRKNTEMLSTFLEQIKILDNELKTVILEGLSTLELTTYQREECNQEIVALNKLKSLKKFELVDSLDDILGIKPDKEPEIVLDGPRKKQKTQQNFLFDTHSDWVPTPFGSVI